MVTMKEVKEWVTGWAYRTFFPIVAHHAARRGGPFAGKPIVTDANDYIDNSFVKADSITNAQLANMAQATIKGRASGAGTGDPTDLTAAQVATIVNSSLDHGTLSGNGDDDHSQYHNDTRGDARYLQGNGTFTSGSAGQQIQTTTVASITTLQSLTIDITSPAVGGPRRMYVTYLDFAGARASTNNIYAYYSGWVAWRIHDAAGTAVVVDYQINHATSGTDACVMPTAISSGIRMVVDSSAFGNTLDMNTLTVRSVTNGITLTVSTNIA